MIVNILPAIVFTVAGIAIILLTARCRRLSERIAKNEFVQYVDTRGVTNLPPSYMDVKAGKTINFRLGKYAIVIPHLPFVTCFTYINNIASCYDLLRKEAENVKGSADFSGAVYLQVVEMIYNISKPFVKDVKGYRKALYRKAMDDVQFTLGVCEQVFDFWKLFKKKLSVLAQTQTLTQMVGGLSSWNSLELDSDGEISVGPRFERFWSTALN